MSRISLIQQVIDLYGEINRLVMTYRADKWLSLDLTISQLKSLIYIYSEGKANYRQLAEALDVTPSVVTGVVDRLISHELISRVDNPEDRRTQWLVVTEKGEAILDNIRQEGIKGVSHILDTLSDDDMSALVQGLSALIEAAHTYLESGQDLPAEKS